MQKKEKFLLESYDCEYDITFYENIFKKLKNQLEVHKQSSDVSFKIQNDLFFLYKGIISRLNLQKIKKDLFESTFSVKYENSELIKNIKKGKRPIIRYLQCVSKDDKNLLLRIVKYKFEKKFVVIHTYPKKKKSSSSSNNKNNITKIEDNKENVSFRKSEKLKSKTTSKNEEDSQKYLQDNSQTLQLQLHNEVKQEYKQPDQQQIQIFKSQNSQDKSIQIVDSQQHFLKISSRESDYQNKNYVAPFQKSQENSFFLHQHKRKELKDNDLEQSQIAKYVETINQYQKKLNLIQSQLNIEMQKSLHFEEMYLQLRTYIVKEKANSLKQNVSKYSSLDTKPIYNNEELVIKKEDSYIEQIEIE